MKNFKKKNNNFGKKNWEKKKEDNEKKRRFFGIKKKEEIKEKIYIFIDLRKINRKIVETIIKYIFCFYIKLYEIIKSIDIFKRYSTI